MYVYDKSQSHYQYKHKNTDYHNRKTSHLINITIECLPVLHVHKTKESACSAGDLGSISGSGRSPGEGNGNPLQYSCLENSIDGGAWWAIVHGVTKSQTWLSNFTFTGKKAMTNLHSVLKSRDITLPTKVCTDIAMVFLVVIYGCES